MSNSYEQEREALGARLRSLRRKAGLTGTALAEGLGWAQSKVSRIERGHQTPSEEDIAAWLDAVDASPETVEDLIVRSRSIQAEHAAWRREYRAGLSRKQRDLDSLAQGATTIRNFETALLPGLLQTAEYARYRLLEQVELHGAPADDIPAAMQARMQRQQVLYQDGRTFGFVVTESVLHTLVCPPQVMQGQLDRLLVLTDLPNVEFGIIPFTTRVPIAPLHGFVMFDQFVLVETLDAEVKLREPEESQIYTDMYARLHRAAVYGAEASALISKAIATAKQ